MKKTNRPLLLITSLLLLIMALSACKPDTALEEDQMSTSVAETLSARGTRTAIARPSDTPVPTPTMVPTLPPVSPTLPPPTVDTTALYGITQSPMPPTADPNATATPAASDGVDRGVWARSEPADGTLIDGGTKFKVKVTIMNTGTTTWTTDYYIQHVNGPTMGVSDKIFMPTEVDPGLSMTFEIEFTGPSEIGTVKSNWAIYNQQNVAIGFFYFEYKFD